MDSLARWLPLGTACVQSLYRQIDGVTKKKYDAYLIVSHGLFSRLFLMRYFRWR